MTRALRDRFDTLLLVVASIAGTMIIALLLAAALARFLPLEPEDRYAIAFVSLIPSWIGLMCGWFLIRRGVVAMASAVVVSAVLATVVYLA